MRNSEITVVIPLYNGEKHIGKTLDALLSQSLNEFEILVIDDGSTDSSEKKVTEFKDARIRLIKQKNLGLALALNNGINQCTTTYIARNDQDDISFPNRLEKQLAYMKANPDVDCIFSYYTKFGKKHGWQNLDKQCNQSGGSKKFRGLEDGCQLASTLFAKTAVLKALGGYRQEYYPSDDWDIELRLIQQAEVHILQEPLVAYRFHLGANTYSRFEEMQLKGAWAESSYYQRQRGMPELTFNAFKNTQKSSFQEKVHQKRYCLAKLFLRKAGQYYLDGCYIPMISYLTLSTILNVSEVINRVCKLFKKNK